MAGEKRDYLLDEIRSVEDTMRDLSSKVSEVDKTLAEYKVSLDHHIAADEKMYDELKRMNDILSVNTESLRTHMRRTELLEQATLKLDSRLSDIEIKAIQREAVKRWISSSIILLGKIIAGVAALAGLVAMVPAFIQWLIK